MIKCAQLTVAVGDALMFVGKHFVMNFQIFFVREDNVAYTAFDFGSALVNLLVRVHVLTRYEFAAF